MKRLAAFLIAALLLLSGRGIFAQPVEEDDPLEMPDQKPLLGRLQLNDQQKKQIEQMRIDMEKRLVGVRAQAQMGRLDMRQLLNAENPDKAAIEKKMGELLQTRVQVATIRLNQWFEVNKILTADQQKVWREVLKHPMRARMGAGMGRRLMEGRGPMMRRHFMGGRPGQEPMGPVIRERIERILKEQPEPEKK